LRDLVDAIHADGAKAIAHLNHAGRAANPKASGRTPEAPSAVVCPTTGPASRSKTPTSRALTDDSEMSASTPNSS
jgi:2,4-dienoyl-CoA reductase-like NADH-dependent reductase (Old Yellow Enzyme family)